MRHNQGPAGDARQTLASGWDILLVVAVGGALGSLARWALGESLAASGDTFPWATFLENVSGAFALGLLMVLVVDVWSPSRYVRPFLCVGVLGGFTTFSTYMLDTRDLVEANRAPLAALYLFGTLIAGLSAVSLGVAVPRLFIAHATRREQRRRATSETHPT